MSEKTLKNKTYYKKSTTKNQFEEQKFQYAVCSINNVEARKQFKLAHKKIVKSMLWIVFDQQVDNLPPKKLFFYTN